MRRLALTALTFLTATTSAFAADVTAQPCRSPGLTPPVALTSHVATAADYPPLSNMLGESGNTVARYTVLPDGSVSDVAVLKSSGSLRLDEATVTFVKGFKFKPALSNGAAVACSSEIMLQWSLHNEEPQAFNNLNIAPIYPTQSDFPPGAIARHEEGAAIAAIIVGETGIVELVALFRHTQFADLDAATVELLRKQKVTAPTVGGKPVRAVILMPVVWSLSGGPLPQPQGLADPQSGDGAQVKGPH